MIRKIARFTTIPDSPPPTLVCPICDTPLSYRETVYNGIRPPERWDVFDCSQCGEFDYRHRTRRLRQMKKLTG